MDTLFFPAMLFCLGWVSVVLAILPFLMLGYGIWGITQAFKGSR